MRKLTAILLILTLILCGCSSQVQEESASIGYKPPEVVGNTTQTTDISPESDDKPITSENKVINGNTVTVGDYSNQFSVSTEENSFTVLTLNMNGADDRDTSKYAARVRELMSLLVQHNPDVITLQEAGSNWMDYIVPQIDGIYDYYLIYPNSDDKADANPIFFKLEKFSDTTGGCFWISDTPDQQSKASNGKFYNCTWLKLEEKATGNQVYFFNSRLDSDVSAFGAEVIRSKCESMGWRNRIVCSVGLGDVVGGAAGQILLKNFANSNTSGQAAVTDKASEKETDLSLYTKVSLTPDSHIVLTTGTISDHNAVLTRYRINTETLNYQDQFIF